MVYLKIDIQALSNLYDNNLDTKEQLNIKMIHDLINQKTCEEIEQFLKDLDEFYSESLILWPEKCKICEKEGIECTYQSNMPCRYPIKMRYSMTGAGVNTDETARNVNIVLEWPPSKVTYRFGLVCLK